MPGSARRCVAAALAARGRTARRRPPCGRRPARGRGSRLRGCPRRRRSTCAAVTTRCGRATQPEPSTPSPHAFAVILTTLGRTARTAGDESAPVPAGRLRRRRADKRLERVDRANARRRSLGGAIGSSAAGSSTADVTAQLVSPGSCRRTAPTTQTAPRPSAAPATRPPNESSIRSGGSTDRPPRANEPANRRRLKQHRADQRAGERDQRRVRRSAPSCSTCGASREPITAPSARAPSESAVATARA